MSDNQDLLDQYFQVAKSEPPVVSYEETRLFFEVNAVATSVSFLTALKVFFTQKLNIIYTLISIAMVTTAVVVIKNLNESKQEQAEQETVVPVIQEEANDMKLTEESPVPVTDVAEINDKAIVKEETSDRSPTIVQEKKPVEKLTNQSALPEQEISDLSKKQVSKTEENQPPESSTEQKVEKPVAKSPAKAAIKPKAPFKYTFTPKTAEADLRKLQEELRKENIILTISKLKYKDGRISKIEGTLEMETYYATFTTDEFDEFTFSWVYNKYKGNAPDKLDIVVNTPMQKKSNTVVHIDQIE